jgi:predicted NACHT family NTPase
VTIRRDQADLSSYVRLSKGIDFSVELRREGNDSTNLDLQTTLSALIASLAENPRVTIVTGAPGSGKTALLAQLTARMVDARISGESQYTPLLLQCKTWTPESRLSKWVTRETVDTYGIANEITRRWLNRGSAILVLDGLDEISDDARQSFIPEVNRWLKSAVGGRAIMSCRTELYVDYFSQIKHEQVANLEPLRRAQVWQYVSQALDRSMFSESMRYDTKSLIDHVLSSDIEQPSMFSTPLLIRLLTDGATTRIREANDPAGVALELGDRLRDRGDDVGAIESYLAAAGTASSQWRSLAAVRASLLLARAGDYDRARAALQSMLANEISQSIGKPTESLSEDLSDDERAVLEALSVDKTLDAFQVSSRSSVSPSRCNAALRLLRDRSLIEVIDNEEKEPRFRRPHPFESVRP